MGAVRVNFRRLLIADRHGLDRHHERVAISNGQEKIVGEAEVLSQMRLQPGTRAKCARWLTSKGRRAWPSRSATSAPLWFVARVAMSTSSICSGITGPCPRNKAEQAW